MGIDMPTCGSVGVWHYLTRLLAFPPDLSVCCLRCPSASISGFKKWGMKVSCAAHSVVTNSHSTHTEHMPKPRAGRGAVPACLRPVGASGDESQPRGARALLLLEAAPHPGTAPGSSPVPTITSPAHRAPAWVAQPLGTCVPGSPSSCPQHRAGDQCPWSPVQPGQRLPKSPHVTVPWDF